MSFVFVASYVVLWAVVILLALIVTDLSRRLQPQKKSLGRQDHGLPFGSSFPQLRLSAVTGENVELIQPRGQGTVVVFASASCRPCHGLLQVLVAFQNKRPGLRIVTLVLGSEEEIREIAERYGLRMPVALLTHEHLEETRNTIFPFGYFLSTSGTVLAKGVLNGEGDLGLLVSAPHFAERTPMPGPISA